MAGKSTKTVDQAELRLAEFLAKYTPEIAQLAEVARSKMRSLYPKAMELVYDNYNALAIGYCPSERAGEAIFSIALYPRWVSLFFLQAKGLPDPLKLLKGGGTTARHIVLTHAGVLDEPGVRELMAAQLERAKAPMEKSPGHKLVIKSVSEKQRPRRPGSTRVKD